MYRLPFVYGQLLSERIFACLHDSLFTIITHETLYQRCSKSNLLGIVGIFTMMSVYSKFKFPITL